jgi:hypothetical protein
MSDLHPRRPRSRRARLLRLGLPAVAIGLLALTIAPGRAFAHASLSTSNPANGSSGPAPSAITMKFTKAFSVVNPGIKLLDGTGKAVPANLSVSGTTIPLTAGASNNLTGFALGSTFDFRVREVAVAA